MSTDEESVDRALKDAAKAWARIQKRGHQNYTDWMTVVGPAFMAAGALAMRDAQQWCARCDEWRADCPYP
jgi:hypothetical protein